MISLRILFARLRPFWRARRLDDDLNDEVHAHLDLLAANYVRQGMSPDDARHAAQRAFGGVEPMKERHRDRRGLRWADDFARDVRYAIRSLCRNPGFTAVAVLTLALGVGANAALFGAVHGYLIQTVPVRDPDTLVAFRWLGEHRFRQLSTEHAYVAGRGAGAGGTFSVGVFRQIQARGALPQLAALASAGNVNVTAGGRADPATGQFVSGGFFDTLGVGAERGRVITPADDMESAEPVVVLSQAYWAVRFAGDPSIVGKALAINGVAFTVAGVMPASFRDIALRGLPPPPDVSIPLAFEPRLRGANSLTKNAGAWWLTLFGRVRDGRTTEQLETSLSGVIEAAVREYAATPKPPAQLVVPRLQAVSARQGLSDPLPATTTRFQLLGAIAGVVLLVVCVNLANLLLSRAVTREREIAVRAAIGASRARIARQLLTESVVLAAAGGGLALVVAAAAGRWLASVFELAPAAAFDWPVTLFAALLSFATAVLFGTVPALRARRSLSAGVMREGANNIARPRARTGRVLLMAQIALTLPLLIAAGLFLRTLANLRDVDVGFDARNIVLFTLEPELSGYDRARTAALYPRIEARLLQVPGVRSVTTAAFGSSLMDGGVIAIPLEGDVEASMLIVDDNFFSTVGIAIRRGQGFSGVETAKSPPVAVVNEALAKRFFAAGDAVGRLVRVGSRQFEIVGVVGDAKVNGLRDPAPPTIYRSVRQLTLPSRRVVVRTASDAAAHIPAIRAAMREIDPQLPLQNVSTQEEVLDANYLVTERMFATASTAVGGLALAVTMVGLFGLMSYTVARRTREFGVRAALGADGRDTLRLVMSDAGRMLVTGMAVGLPLAWAASGLVRSMLFGVTPTDGGTVALSVAALLAAALAAAYLPARRAMAVNPIVALRSE